MACNQCGQWLRHGRCQSIDTIYYHELGQNVDKPWYCAICGSPNLLGTETWLDPSIPNSEILPSLNNVYRKDGGGKVGGVLTAVLNTLDSSAAPELEDEGCEMLWVRVKLKGRRTFYLCAYCRPNAADETSLRKLGQSLERASQLPKAHLLIGGDFNFPGWDWQTTTPTLKSRAPYPGLHHDFHDLINDHGLQQLVREPTREDNTLDLYLTNCPRLIPRTEDIPGLPDHNIPYCVYASPCILKPTGPAWRKWQWTSARLNHGRVKGYSSYREALEHLHDYPPRCSQRTHPTQDNKSQNQPVLGYSTNRLFSSTMPQIWLKLYLFLICFRLRPCSLWPRHCGHLVLQWSSVSEDFFLGWVGGGGGGGTHQVHHVGCLFKNIHPSLQYTSRDSSVNKIF